MPSIMVFATGMEIAIATLLLLIGGFLFFGSEQRNVPAVALSVVAVLVGLSVFLSTLASIEGLQWIRLLRPLLAFLFGPAIYIYVSRVRQRAAPLRPAALLHVVPAIVGMVLMAVMPGPHTDMLINVCLGAYWVASVVTFSRNRHDYVPATVRRFVYWLIVVFGVVIVLDTILSYQANTVGTYRNLATYLLALGATLAGAFRMMWTALKHPQLLVSPATGIKYARSVLDDRSIASLSQRFDRLMNEDKVYLQEDVSLASVASLLNAQSRHVSQMVNSRFSTNFSAYINTLRISEAARRLSSSEQTVTDVMFAVGFNSKSTFNREFRRQFDASPTEWRRRARQ